MAKWVYAFGGGKAELALANPIAADLSDMRPSLLPGLIAAAQRNADRGFPQTALFELGQIFLGDKPTDQRMAAAEEGRAARHQQAGHVGAGNEQHDQHRALQQHEGWAAVAGADLAERTNSDTPAAGMEPLVFVQRGSTAAPAWSPRGDRRRK